MRHEGTAMELVEVEAVEDRTRPEGGHAVIVLRGAGALPASARFRLQAVDADAAPPEARALLERTHEPLGIRMTEDGIALEIGPGLADSAFLVPGIALEITLVDAGLRGEFLWPSVTPLARPKRRNIMTRRVAGEMLPAAMAQPPAMAPAPVSSVDEKPAPAPSAPLPAEPVSIEVPPRRPVVVSAARSHTSAAPRSGTVPEEPTAADVPAVEPWIDVPASPAEAQVVAASPSPILASAGDRPAPATAPVVQPSPATAVAQSGTSPRMPGRWTPANVAAVTVAALLGLQLVGLRLFDLRIAKRADTPAVTASAPVVRDRTAGIYDVLATEPASPRGLAADGISPARALQLAHDYQHGPEAGRDRDEAIYWLKRYVISTTGNESTRIAMTQLGSAYARPTARGSNLPDKGPDMGRAIAAWELAAAMGDTVAMCFLATVHERGLGVAADPAAATAWAARAARGSGCATPGPAGAVPSR